MSQTSSRKFVTCAEYLQSSTEQTEYQIKILENDVDNIINLMNQNIHKNILYGSVFYGIQSKDTGALLEKLRSLLKEAGWGVNEISCSPDKINYNLYCKE